MFVPNGKMLSSWCLLCLISMYLLKLSFMEEVENDTSIEKITKRPFWNIAHMVNSIKEVDKYINQMANSIEFDVFFNKTGIATYTYHGPPCDFNRECNQEQDFVEYIEYMRNLTSPDSSKFRKRLVLLFMDFKLELLTPKARVTAGEDVAMKLLDHYWQRGESTARAYILISVSKIEFVDFIRSFRNTLKNKSGNFTAYDEMIGYAFSDNEEDLSEIAKTYETEMPGIQNIWQGDGISNWCYCEANRLKKCIDRRDESNDTRSIDKVYYWTVDNEKAMKETLWLGVDGMITNYPKRLQKLIKEHSEFKSLYRLATIDDNPWEKYTSNYPSNFTDFINGTLLLRNLEDLTTITLEIANMSNLRDEF